jgi:hypothetical protein
MTKPRTIVAVALAAGTFGGTIGALATAAVQSRASPEAIAAAVQRVSDSNAEQSLRGISAKLGTANGTLKSLGADLSTVQTDLAMLDRTLGNASGGAIFNIADNLRLICQNTSPSLINACSP